MKKLFFFALIISAFMCVTSCSEEKVVEPLDQPNTTSSLTKPATPTPALPDVTVTQVGRFMTRAYGFVDTTNGSFDQEGYENFLMDEFNLSQDNVFNLIIGNPLTEIPNLGEEFYTVLDLVKAKLHEVGYIGETLYNYTEHLCSEYNLTEVEIAALMYGLDIMKTVEHWEVVHFARYDDGAFTRSGDLQHAISKDFNIVTGIRMYDVACGLAAGAVGYAAGEFVTAAIAAGLITGGVGFLAFLPGFTSVVVGALWGAKYCVNNNGTAMINSIELYGNYNYSLGYSCISCTPICVLV